MKKNLPNLKTMVMALAILFSGAANAFTAVTSGNWSSAATWGGVAPGSAVLNADIIIPAGITVTLDTDVTFIGQVVNTFSVSGTLSSTTNNKLLITQGALSGNGTISIRNIMFSGLATATFAGTLIVNELHNTATLALVTSANISDSLVLDAGSLLLNTNSNLSLMTGATVRINNGSISLGGGILNTSNNYNVLYVGSSKVAGVELNSATVQNFTVKMSSNSESVTIANSMTVNANLNLSAGKLNFSGRKITLIGDLMIANGAALTSDGSSSLEIRGSGALTSNLVFTSGSTMHDLIVNRATTVKLLTPIAMTGTLSLMSGTLSLEAGSSITMSAGSKVHVEAGILVLNVGNFIGTAAYDVEYMGAANATAGAELIGSGLSNVTINFTNVAAKVMLSTNVSIPNNLIMMSGNLDLNGQNITINGVLTQSVNSKFIGNANSEMTLNLLSASNSTLYFDNTSTANQTLSKLKMNVSGTAAVVLGTPLIIKNELNFVKGKLLLDNSDLTIQSTANITGYDDTRYVATSGTGSGRLQMNVIAGSSYVTFPVGTLGNYSPAQIQQTAAGTSGNIMIKVLNDVLTAGYSGYPIGVLSAVSRTWYIEAESTVSVSMNMKLGWVAAAELNGFNRANAMIRHYTNNSWDTYVLASATAGANNTFELSRTGITSLSPFAVADNAAPLKVAELANTVEFDMYPNPAKDVVTLKAPASSYKYEIVDVTGRTVEVNQKTGSSFNIAVSDLQPGCYFIKVTNLTNSTTGVKRFIKD